MDLGGFLHVRKAGRLFSTLFYANSGVMLKQSLVCMYQHLNCKHDVIIVEYMNNYLLYAIVKSKQLSCKWLACILRYYYLKSLVAFYTNLRHL
jgi:hypothetical protein